MTEFEQFRNAVVRAEEPAVGIDVDDLAVLTGQRLTTEPQCLCCRERFPSRGAANRVCDSCRKSAPEF